MLFLPSSLVILFDNNRILIIFKRIKSLYFLFNYFKIHLFCQKISYNSLINHLTTSIAIFNYV